MVKRRTAVATTHVVGTMKAAYRHYEEACRIVAAAELRYAETHNMVDLRALDDARWARGQAAQAIPRKAQTAADRAMYQDLISQSSTDHGLTEHNIRKTIREAAIMLEDVSNESFDSVEYDIIDFIVDLLYTDKNLQLRCNEYHKNYIQSVIVKVKKEFGIMIPISMIEICYDRAQNIFDDEQKLV